MRRFLLWLVAVGTINPMSIGQTQTQHEWLQRFSSDARVSSQRARADAEFLAIAKGMPVQKIFPDGSMIELQRFENERPMYYMTHNLNAAKTISTDRVWPGGTGGFSLTGSTDTLAIWDGGPVLATHQEFGGRVNVIDGGEAAGHATHVAGTMIAAGVYADARGMSSQARLRSYDWTNDLSEMASAADAGLRVSNHSYGYITGWYWNFLGDSKWAWFGDTTVSNTTDFYFGFYSYSVRAVDNVAFNAPNYLIVRSAGNDRGDGPASQPIEHWVFAYNTWVLRTVTRSLDGGSTGHDCIEGDALGKNVLTVGAVYDITTGYTQPGDVVMPWFSSWGPTDDGRIKPDIVANGIGLISSYSTGDSSYASSDGTSMASPNVSGSIGLLLQHQKNLWGSARLRAATLKALVVHTADEAGTAPGPDYQFGWGLMNTLNAANVMQQDSTAGGDFRIRELLLSQGQTIDIPVYSDGTQPLRATICWTDPAGTPPPNALNPPAIMLVNDIDLRITGNSTTYSPWILDPATPGNAATTGDNIRDNVEQVHVTSPAAGWYTVRITHKAMLAEGQQAVSLIISGPPIPIVANLRAFLQGPYISVSDTMTTALGSAGYLPTHHPYGVPPWSYLGTDSVRSIPAAVVDWVLVQLRTGTDSSSTVASRAAFIKSDGTIVDTSGVGPVKFSSVAAGNYYIVLRHRNHLAVMSANAVALSSTSSEYDFTIAANKAYGADAMKGMGTGNTAPFALFAADANGSGDITILDRAVWRVENSLLGYLNSDFNMDGEVTIFDRALWRLNNSLVTPVP
jgi:hypothetical protein